MNDIFNKHLLTYLDKKSIDCLIDSITKKRLTGLLLNTNKLDKKALTNFFPTLVEHNMIANGFIYDPMLLSPGKSFLFDAGVYYIQDLSAMLTASLLDFNSNDFVVDLCASPGGKSVQASLKMAGKGLIVANDISGLRAKVLSQNVERMGLANVIVTNEDALNLLTKLKTKPTKIILDAPCSGSGMFRKLESIRQDWSIEKVYKYAKIQKELISKAFETLADGGTLLYSTCSFSYEENEEVMFHLLNNYENAELINIREDKSFYRDDKLKQAIHLFPHLYEGDGQFICLIKKRGELVYETYKESTSTFLNYHLNLVQLTSGENIYGISTVLKQNNLNILRYGVHLGTISKSIITPHHHLAHYLSAKDSIALSEQEKNAYIKGLTINRHNVSNGYHVVSYLMVNLGFVKAVNGVLKNHYPKGLRH